MVFIFMLALPIQAADLSIYSSEEKQFLRMFFKDYGEQHGTSLSASDGSDKLADVAVIYGHRYCNLVNEFGQEKGEEVWFNYVRGIVVRLAKEKSARTASAGLAVFTAAFVSARLNLCPSLVVPL